MQHLWPQGWILDAPLKFGILVQFQASCGQVWASSSYSNHSLTHKKQQLTKTGSDIKGRTAQDKQKSRLAELQGALLWSTFH